MKTRILCAVLAALAVLSLTALLLVACSSDIPPQDGAGTRPDASAVQCGTPQAGCACQTGQTAMCGVQTGTAPDGHPECARGTRSCDNGTWGACDTGPGSSTSGQSTAPMLHILAPVVVDGGCSGNACDPYCQQTSQTYDGGLSDPDAQGVSNWDGGADGPPNSVITGYLNDSGIVLDGSIYHELNPGQTAIDPVNLSTTLNSVDIYFALNSTTSTEPSIKQLATQLPGVVTALQSQIPSAAFGDGNFTNYAAWPYAPQTNGNTVFANRVNLTTNGNAVVNDFNWMSANANSFFQQTPYVVAQSTTPALYLLATNETMGGWACWNFPNQQPADWWWNIGYYGQSACNSTWNIFTAQPACPNGGIGAACFRPNAYHIIMLLQSAPAMNGAFGSFPYYQYKPAFFTWNATADYTTENSWFWYYSPSLGGSPGSPVLPVNSGGSQAMTLPSVGQPLVYAGNVVGKSSQNSITAATVYDPSAKQTCTVNQTPLGNGPDAHFDFTVGAGGQKYWFDTFGTSYDTVLYIIDRTTGLVMGCNDDGFAWATSAPTCCGVTATQWAQSGLNSALIGQLPAGNYRLVLDMNGTAPATQNTGLYQLNLWPNIDDPMMGGNPRGTSHTTPSYRQAIQALKAPALNAYVMSIEMSGQSCGQQPASWENAWTRWSLEQYAYDTGAVVGGKPLVYSVQQDGTPGPASGNDPNCPNASNLGSVVAGAVSQLTNNLAQPITAVANDFDDLTDYDGVTGISAGPTVLTPTNIDDATFVSSIVAQPTAGCTGPSGNTYASCSPGTTPNFQVSFAVPPTVVARTNPQIFRFNLELHGAGNVLMSTKQVVIVVPPAKNIFLPTSYTTDFDGVASCSATPGTFPLWNIYSWNATTPGNSYIQFFATAADTLAHLSTNTELSPAFGIAQASPNTQVSQADLHAFLVSKGVTQANSAFVRVRAYLAPTSDQQQTPTLNSWNMSLDCTASE